MRKCLTLLCLFCGERLIEAFVASVKFARTHSPNNKLLHGSNENNEEQIKEPDLFDFFDPLLSPHAYPNGISPNDPPVKQESMAKSKSRAVTRPKQQFGIAMPTLDDDSTTEEKKTDLRPAVDASSIFDPTLSPHFYANGTPDLIIGDENVDTVIKVVPLKKKKLGVLLMDHGSKNEKSNARLQKLAQLYQESLLLSDDPTTTVVVEAAHMEIASPSIQDGMQALLKAGVDEIVCHPYFLSPGRHVQDDIPRLVAQAIESLAVEIPVRTTEPVGSQTDVMIRVIHSLVQETSELYKTAPKARR